jgi:hypothetical protein
MKSETLPSFWDAYTKLTFSTRKAAKKAFQLWEQNPFHPSLHFKCINADENIWSVRISLKIRALAVIQDDATVWFWIGSHDEYQKYFK